MFKPAHQLASEESKQKIADKDKKQLEWDVYFLKMAELVASKSCDTSLKVGCVIVGPNHEIRTTGYNGFPRSVEPNDKRLQRPTKYSFTEHGERNAIFNAARVGTSLDGCIAYVACTPRDKGGRIPCNDCARAFINAGITNIVEWDVPCVGNKNDRGAWRETLVYSYEMLKEAGVKVRFVSYE